MVIQSGKAGSRELRIIGGSWRGRRLRFPSGPEIRPTPDRVRETLFNWLAPGIAGARCLDLFAGSGALGLEALSRGASHVTFVERDGVAAREIRARAVEWGATGAVVEQSDALRFLTSRAPPIANSQAPHAPAPPYDVVFLDPPFAAGLLGQAATLLEERGWLAAQARIYVECAAREGLPALPPSWSLLKAKRAGEVGYHLLTRADPERGAGTTGTE